MLHSLSVKSNDSFVSAGNEFVNRVPALKVTSNSIIGLKSPNASDGNSSSPDFFFHGEAVTLLKTVVQSLLVLCEVTASPICVALAMLIV